ncbi:MAG: sodium:proton exchanger [Planctomycetes bacterium]|nr:sodium:proton exchanger [Planctomycetota bacterium]
MDLPFLDDLALVALVAVVTTVALSRWRLPLVAGLLLAGALVGPAGFGLVRDLHAIEVLAEVGVVLLLFTIGLEFSLARLARIWRMVAIGGTVQVALTVLATLGLALALGWSAPRGVFLGCLFALSSTAIVLRALSERSELDAPHGRFIVGVLLFQDLCVVPMVLAVPVLAGAGGEAPGQAIALALLEAAGVVLATVVVARRVLPPLFAKVDRARSREIFLLAVVGLCLGTAWLTASAGLSTALGAFVAGVVLADTDYGERALGDMLPFRDVLTSLFFVSLGMLFDIGAVLAAPLAVVGFLAVLLLVKGAVATAAALAMQFPARAAWLAGVGLAQFGEFGFVLLRQGQGVGLVDATLATQVLDAGVISMFLTPLLVRLAPHVTAGERLLRPLERRLGVRGVDEAPDEAELTGHVLIVGFGLAGRRLAAALRDAGKPYAVLELNAERVRQAREDGERIWYADVTSPEAMHHAGLARATAVVLLINDPFAARRALHAMRTLAPDVPVLVRCRYDAERAALEQLGAREVVVEEVEAANEMVRRTLQLAPPRAVA